MSAPKKFKSALKKLCDRAKSALNSQARISSPAKLWGCQIIISPVFISVVGKDQQNKHIALQSENILQIYIYNNTCIIKFRYAVEFLKSSDCQNNKNNHRCLVSFSEFSHLLSMSGLLRAWKFSSFPKQYPLLLKYLSMGTRVLCVDEI